MYGYVPGFVNVTLNVVPKGRSAPMTPEWTAWPGELMVAWPGPSVPDGAKAPQRPARRLRPEGDDMGRLRAEVGPGNSLSGAHDGLRRQKAHHHDAAIIQELTGASGDGSVAGSLDCSHQSLRLQPRALAQQLIVVLSALIVTLLPGVLHADDDSLTGPRHTSYTLDWDKRRLPGPQSYELEWEIEGPRLAPGGLKDPADLFLDRAGYLYIVDRGNDRVVRLTSDGAFVDIIGPSAPDGLSQPEGVFVANDGEIYVADTGHSRVVVFNPDGSFKHSIGAPHSSLLEEGPYKPSKLIVDRRGYIYVIESGGDYRGILLLDYQGAFRGFFAANPVGFSLQRWFARIFATEEQKKQLSRTMPTWCWTTVASSIPSCPLPPPIRSRSSAR